MTHIRKYLYPSKARKHFNAGGLSPLSPYGTSFRVDSKRVYYFDFRSSCADGENPVIHVVHSYIHSQVHFAFAHYRHSLVLLCHLRISCSCAGLSRPSRRGQYGSLLGAMANEHYKREHVSRQCLGFRPLKLKSIHQPLPNLYHTSSSGAAPLSSPLALHSCWFASGSFQLAITSGWLRTCISRPASLCQAKWQ
jgi:hypothetical protein